MTDPARLRDSTQIVVPSAALDDVRACVEKRYTVTILETGEYARIIGSPVVIKDLGNFLARSGVNLP